ncbi:hypothetical protein D3C87_2062960 [compost metagenome]
MEVETAKRRQRQQLVAQQITVIEGENNVRLHLANAFDPQRVVNVLRRIDR